VNIAFLLAGEKPRWVNIRIARMEIGKTRDSCAEKELISEGYSRHPAGREWNERAAMEAATNAARIRISELLISELCDREEEERGGGRGARLRAREALEDAAEARRGARNVCALP